MIVEWGVRGKLSQNEDLGLLGSGINKGIEVGGGGGGEGSDE